MQQTFEIDVHAKKYKKLYKAGGKQSHYTDTVCHSSKI